MQDKISEKKKDCTAQDLGSLYMLHNKRVHIPNCPLIMGKSS